MKPTVIFETPLPEQISASYIEFAAEKTIDYLKKQLTGSINLSFVDKEVSQQLNCSYAQNDYPTDVLSFEYGKKDYIDNPEISQSMAEIVICTPIAVEQAEENKISLEDEITLLFVHGMLHSLGYDHQNEAQKASFTQAQDDIIKSLGKSTRKMKWSH